MTPPFRSALSRGPSAEVAERLAQQCAELGRALAAADDSFAIAWDGGDRPVIVAAGGPVEALLGVSPAALVGKPAGSIFSGGERAARDLAEACKSGPVCEERLLLRNGQAFEALLLIRAGDDGAVAVVRDLAVWTQKSEAVRGAKDLARFASLVAHEVRNPLSAVKIALQTLERHGSLAPNDRRRVSIAGREVGSIEVLLTEVLEFARPPSLEMVPIDPRTPVRDALATVESEWKGRGVTFTSKLDPRIPPMHLDPTRVRTAARILCRHGAIAADEIGGGEVEVELSRLPGGGCELRVLDKGHPLPPELRQHAFEPFTPTRARGTGLGLAIVLRIAREHGGAAEVRDRAGGGNVLTLTLPGR